MREIVLPYIKARCEGLINTAVAIVEDNKERVESNTHLEYKAERNFYYFYETNQIFISIDLAEFDICFGFIFSLMEEQKTFDYEHFYEKFGSAIRATIIALSKSCAYFQNEKYIDQVLFIQLLRNCVFNKRATINDIDSIFTYINSVRQFTFEGNHFTYGIIYSNSDIHELKLENAIKLHNEIQFSALGSNYRYSYMVDGKQSFHYLNRKMDVIFTLIRNDYEKNESFVKYYCGDSIIKNNDVIGRVVNHNYISFVNINGDELIYKNGEFKLRSLFEIVKSIGKIIKINDNVSDSIIFYLVKLVEIQRSCILFFPDMEYLDMFISITKIYRDNISINNKEFQGLIIRMLSSDGVTIINKEGEIIANGGIVKLDYSIKNEGLSGTGNLAAKVLSKKGSSIKISQDGNISIYNQKYPNGIKF
jgi:hypothetical protein